MGFHPLKSGRDFNYTYEILAIVGVSIPSSRVGTDLEQGSSSPGRRFPSPQVGSGHTCATVSPASNDVSIPSSRVGTGDRRGCYGGHDRFPSPQVGSGPRCRRRRLIHRLGFHPLKSGRDMQQDEGIKVFENVSIPSSRVGTAAKAT